MYQPWPDPILCHPGFHEEFHPRTGDLLFRGPRLKIGLSEGAPKTIAPDHLGRADYHGHHVNMASRSVREALRSAA